MVAKNEIAQQLADKLVAVMKPGDSVTFDTSPPDNKFATKKPTLALVGRKGQYNLYMTEPRKAT